MSSSTGIELTTQTFKGSKALGPSIEAQEIRTSKDEQFYEVESVATRDGDTVRKLQPRHVALIGIGGYVFDRFLSRDFD